MHKAVANRMPVDGIAPGSYLDELERMVPMARMTAAARQRIAYEMAEMAEMEEQGNGKLRSEGGTEGRKHFL